MSLLNKKMSTKSKFPPKCRQRSAFSHTSLNDKSNHHDHSIFDHWAKKSLERLRHSSSHYKKPQIPRPYPKKESMENSLKIKSPKKNDETITVKAEAGSPRKRTMPKTKSYNRISARKQSQTSASRLITRIVERAKFEYEKSSYEWRVNTHFPFIKVSVREVKTIFLENNMEECYEMTLQVLKLDEIKYKLPEIPELTLLNCIYIVKEALVGFERLFYRFGSFQPSAQMIFVTEGLRCKVWINSDVFVNEAENCASNDRQSKLSKSEDFYGSVVSMFSRHLNSAVIINPTRRSINLLERLLQGLSSQRDFIEGLKFIKEFCVIYNLSLGHRYRQSFTRCGSIDLRSRIPSNIEFKNQTVGSQSPRPQFLQHLINKKKPQQSYKILVSGEEEQEKNGTFNKDWDDRKEKQRNCKEESKDSGCRTINNSNETTQMRQKVADFKRQSQMSICSKQTLPSGKKERFSIQQSQTFFKNAMTGSQQIKNSQFKSRLLPEFTNQDYEQEDQRNLQLDGGPSFTQAENLQIPESPDQTKYSRMKLFKMCKVVDDEELEQQRALEIENEIRERNGWLSPNALLGNALEEDCAKSYRDSQPEITNLCIRDRNLSKLNRFKKSIANSIVDGSIF